MKLPRRALILLLLAWCFGTPAATWINLGLMTDFRSQHTATLLPDGQVLIVAGAREGNPTPWTELYDPTTGQWTNGGRLLAPRQAHTATLLPNGKLLVVGGYNSDSVYTGLATAELRDPVTGEWTSTGSTLHYHYAHSATLLPNGKVLVAGNWNNSFVENYAELYDPQSGAWTNTTDMPTARAGHTATLLLDGRVLLVGGLNGSAGYLASTVIYNPVTASWTTNNPMAVARQGHTATLLRDGRVLVTGGSSFGTYHASMEIFAPATGTWTTCTNQLTNARVGHSSTLLPNGKVLLAGGLLDGAPLATAEIFDPATEACTPTATFNTGRWLHTASLLPEGRVLVAGGVNQFALRNTELFDPQEGAWATTNGLITPRYNAAATVLTNGQVLVLGGIGTNNDFFTSTELFNPQTGTWTESGVLTNSRIRCHAVLLPSGKVLVSGGVVSDGNFAASDLYDPGTGAWTPTGAMKLGRYGHTVTLLPNGKVLASGGAPDFNAATPNCELFDPATSQWQNTGSMTTNREDHSATLLPTGHVLVTGGFNRIGGYHALASAELYNPGSETWTATAPTLVAHGESHVAVLLPSGKVLVAGGYNSANGYLSNAELYNPATGLWSNTGNMLTGRMRHQAVLLPNGKVLVFGGLSFAGPIANAELYDPVSGLWTAAPTLASNLIAPTTTLLLDGRVLVAGGSSDSIPVNEAFLFNPAPSLSPSGRPEIIGLTSPLITGGNLTLTGSNFSGMVEGTTGTPGDSARNFPLVQLRNVANGQSRFVLVTNWSPNSLNTGPVLGFPPGLATVTVYVNGLPSRSAFLLKQRIAASVTISNLSHVYDRTAKQPAASTVPMGRAVYFTYNGSPHPVTNAGVYSVVASIDDLDYAGFTTNVFTITPANATISLGNLSQVYNGTARPITATTVPPSLQVAFTYNGSAAAPTNPGTYTVVGSIADPNAFPRSVTNLLVVSKAAATVTLGSLSQTYNGAARFATATTVPYGLGVELTYNGSPLAPTNAGSYTVIGTVVSPFYQGSKTNTMTVAKATAVINLSNLTQVYDGNAHRPTAATVPPGLGVEMTYYQSQYAPTNAGTYTVFGAITNQNYQGSTTASLVVQKAPATVLLGNLYQTFSGAPRNVSVSTTPSGLGVSVTYNGTAALPVAAGNYTVVGTVNAQNYSGASTNTLQIFPAIILQANLLPDGRLVLSFTNKPSSLFSVLATTNTAAASANWVVLGSATEISPGNYRFTNATAGANAQLFYRIRSP